MNKHTLELISAAYDKLKAYNGTNSYIIRLKNGVYAYKNITLNDFQAQFILENYNFEPKFIGKVVKIADWWAKNLKEKYNLSFIPQRIEIGYYLGQSNGMYAFFARFTTGQKEGVLLVVKKDAIFTDFLSEDYTKLQVDFNRYDRLAERIKPGRKIKEVQKTGIKFLLSRKKCILADDTGYGKTTELSVAAVEGNYDSILIICPASIKTKWKEELMYYVPEKDITIIDSFNSMKKGELEKFLGYKEGKSGLKRDELLDEAKSAGKWQENKFVIVNFDIIDEFYKMPKRSKASIAETYTNSPILQYIMGKKSLLIVDEAHKLSTNDSIRYKVIQDLIKRGKPESIYLATGTPITNNPQNFYYVLKLLDHPITSNREEFFKRYCDAKKVCHPRDKEKRNKISQEFIVKHGCSSWYELTKQEKDQLQVLIEKRCWMMTVANGASNLEELKERVSDVYIRRLKEDLGGLPPKHVDVKVYDLTSIQYAEYQRLWEEYESSKTEENPDKELNKELLEGAVYRKYLSNQMIPNTEKIVDGLIKKGEKVVVICCYDEELYALGDYYGDRCVIYNGKMDLKHKDAAIKKFYEDPNVSVFIGNIVACSVGIDLVCSNHLIFNNMSYVPADNRQAEDRIWRISQTKDCYVTYQMFRDTQYTKMWDKFMGKELVINQVIKKESEK